jgi:hypothetical protein
MRSNTTTKSSFKRPYLIDSKIKYVGVLFEDLKELNFNLIKSWTRKVCKILENFKIKKNSSLKKIKILVYFFGLIVNFQS